MVQQIADQRVLGVEDQGLAFLAETVHAKSHALGRVHLHHISHTAALFVHSQDGSGLLILEILQPDRQLVVLHGFFERFGQLFFLLAESRGGLFAGTGLEGVLDIRVDPGEMDAFIFGFQLLDEGLVNVVPEDKGLHLLGPEHLDILALLLLISHVVDGAVLFGLFRLLLFHDLSFDLLAVLVYSFLFFHIDLVDFQGLGQRQELAVQVLEKDIVGHLPAELVVAQAAVLDEGADVVPVLVVVLLIGLAHAGQLVRHLLGDVIGDLCDKAVVLQGAPGNIQGQVRTVDGALEQHQEFRNDFLDVIRDKYLVVIQLDHTLGGFIFQVDLGEVKDTLEIERIVHVQVDPEQGLFIILEDLSVEFLVFLIGAVFGILAPEGMDLVHQGRPLADLQLLFLIFLLFFAFLLLGLDHFDDDIFRPSLRLLNSLGHGSVQLRQIDLNRHEGAVFLDDFLRPPVVGEFLAVI